MKRYIEYSFGFLIAGLLSGVFYREYSKFFNLSKVHTTLGLVHPHFLVLGVLFILLIGLVNCHFCLAEEKQMQTAVMIYALGTAGSGVMLLVRGICDVLTRSGRVHELSRDAEITISAFSGVFHIVLSAGILTVFILWLRNCSKNLKK